MEIKTITPWFLIICNLFLVTSIISNISQVVKSQKRMTNAIKKVESLNSEQQRMIWEKSQQNSQYYLESQIRNNLKMVKPGETLVVVPEQLKQNSEETVYKYAPKDEDEKEIQKKRPIEEWEELIL